MLGFEPTNDYLDDLSSFASDPAFDLSAVEVAARSGSARRDRPKTDPSSGVADEALGSAAAIRDTAPEESFRRNHQVTTWFPPGEAAGNETKYELECTICGVIGATKGKELADVLARLHENFVSVLVDLRESQS
jgi:hypothetical protein